jgi:hypothetical protein
LKSKFDFSKISEGLQPNIYLGALSSQELFDRQTYGFLWDNSTYQLIKTQRTELLLDNSILQIHALAELLEIIEEFNLRFSGYNFEYNIYIDNPATYGLIINSKTLPGVPINRVLNNVLIKKALLERIGIQLNFYESDTNLKLLEHLNFALTGFELRNDFQNETVLLSSVSSAYLDDTLFQWLENNKIPKMLIQYISENESGKEGILKRIILPVDEAAVNHLLENTNGLNPQFPFNKHYINSKIRRMTMTIRDADLCLLFSSSIFGSENFVFPDNYYFIIAQELQKKIFVFDTDSGIWYRKSTSGKRELVRQKRFNIYDYKNISYFCRPNIVSKIYDRFTKLIQS